MKAAHLHRNWTKDDACIPAPVVKDAVLGYMRQLGAPVLQRDLWRPLGLPRTAVNRVLDRALKAGLVTRRPIMVDCVMHARARFSGGTAIRRQMYLYSLVEGA